MNIKRFFCNHEDEHFFLTKDGKMGSKIVLKEGLNVEGLNVGSKWICKKCGRVKYYQYGF